MKKPLLLPLVIAMVLTINVHAKSMFDEFQLMKKEMNSLKLEVTTLKEEAAALAAKAEEEEQEEEEEVVQTDPNIVPIEDVLNEGIDDSEDDEEDEDEFDDETTIAELEESISELNRATGGNHLKFQVDYRFAVDNLQYKMADGSTAKNDAFLTNRLWLNMGYKATNNLTFKGQLAYNKAFGARSGVTPANSAYEEFDWISSENPYEQEVKVRYAYFLWQDRTFLGAQIPWTFSIGRRPSTNGHLINLRDDDHASSPLAHTINVEFDGLSSRFTFSKEWGTSIKLCAGRGLTNANVKFSPTPYATTTSIPDIDLGGLIFVPFNNGQYSINTQYYYAANLIDANDALDQSQGLSTVGGLHSFSANITMKGIGDEWSDFLDNTTFFLSGAYTKTDPKSNSRMLYGDTDLTGAATTAGESKSGYSIWVGTQFPSFTEDGKFGLEFNQGSQYFRSITYAEDTNIGSKIAARGNAYEAYMTEYLVEDILSLQIRYTYIDYKYTGSNGFFGSTSGASYEIEELAKVNPTAAANVVDKAQDIRFYIRYKY